MDDPATEVTIDEFKRLEMRVGTVVEVSRVPRTNKLYKVVVDLGTHGRKQTATSLVDFYKAEELLHKRVIFLANLKPTTFAGQKSEGMLLAAAEGEKLALLGIELKDIQPFSSNVKLLKMDVYEKDVPDRIIAELGGPANAVLSDLAPSIIGAWDVDHARQVDLARRALEIAEKVLDYRGNVLIKLFEGPERKKLQDDAALFFESSRLLKPKASRPEASEIYFLGLGFKARWHQSRKE